MRVLTRKSKKKAQSSRIVERRRGADAPPVAKKRRGRKRKAKKKQSQRFLNDQMGDVQLPLTLASPAGQPWMEFTPDVVDNLRHMMTRLTRTGPIPERIAVIGALPDEGVTYVSRALATVMANDLAARVCLVDLNWWFPGSPRISPKGNGGLVSVITGEQRLDEVFVDTALPNLTIVPAGYLERSERPIMARSNVLESALDVLGKYFDHLIFDIPAIRATNDAVPLATHADKCVLVTRQGVTAIDSVKLALDEVAHLDVIGAVLNEVSFSTPTSVLRLIPQD